MGELALTDLRQIEGEPRVLDLRLGERLGYGRAVKVREIIRRNVTELRSHGTLKPHGGASISGKGRVMASEEFYLNEAQAVLVCMLARTPAAVELRRQVVQVFLAWRHGRLERSVQPARPAKSPKVDERATRWARMERRIEQLEKALKLQAKVEEGEAFARAVAYMPNVLMLDHPDGRRRKQARPRWWYDLPVREAVIAHHRQMTLYRALELLRQEFGNARIPSRSSLARFWLTLDEVRAAQ